jgi:hypothetical protein
VEGQHRVLELVGPEPSDDVRRHEDQRIADRDLAAPHVGLEAARRQSSLAVRVGQRREPRLADEIGLGRPDRGDIHLVAADNGQANPDRAVALGRFQAEPVSLMDEALVGGRDRLLDADPDPGRLVVVVLVPDRLGRQPRRLERVARADARRHQQVQVPLRARHRTHARFDDDERVRRVGEAIVLGDETELQLESGAQAGLS